MTFSVQNEDLAGFTQAHMGGMSDDAAENFMNSYSLLWDGEPNHGLDYIAKGTEHVFSANVFHLFEVRVMKKASTYTYKVIKSAWGVKIIITAEVHLNEGSEEERVAPEFPVWLKLSPCVADLPLDYQEKLKQGMGVVATDIFRATEGSPVTVTVQEVSYVESDFQAEGLPVAMFRWAEDAFKLPERQVTESFDRAANRYHFTWT